MGRVRQTAIAGLLAASLAGADAPSRAQDAWRAVRELRFADAIRVARTDTSSAARLAEATALVQLQPVTRENLDAADGLLRELVNADDADLAAGARYQLARLLQLNPFGPNLSAAIEQFETLEREHPQHRLAEAGVVKRAIILLHTAPGDGQRRALFDRFEKRIGSLTDPVARRDMHMTLAGVAARFDLSPAVALRHLQRVDPASVAKDRSLADLLVRRGETAMAASDPADARLAFELFLARFPADQRSYYIRRQLESITPQEGRD